jgi:hypothetical protein
VSTDAGTGTGLGGASNTTAKRKPSGRRDLRKVNIPEVRVEIADPFFDELVRDGKAERVGFVYRQKESGQPWQRTSGRTGAPTKAAHECTKWTIPMPPSRIRKRGNRASTASCAGQSKPSNQ